MPPCLSGQAGDVLLTYENEVILTNEVYGDKALPYLIPRHNVRIECPIAVVDAVRAAHTTPHHTTPHHTAPPGCSVCIC